jgi:hypothetical protein
MMRSPYTRATAFGNVDISSVLTAIRDPSTQQTIMQAAPVVSSLVEATQDPIRRLYVLRADLQQAVLRGAPLPVIQGLRAKVAAAERAAAIKVEGETSTREWRALGKTAISVGIAAGVGLTLLIFAGALRTVRGRR